MYVQSLLVGQGAVTLGLCTFPLYLHWLQDMGLCGGRGSGAAMGLHLLHQEDTEWETRGSFS